MNQQNYINLLSKDIIDKLNILIRVQGEQSKKVIGQIMYLSDTNQTLSEHITNLIVFFFKSLKSIDERLNIIYLVDSMMKWIENSPFIETFSKYLVFMFSVTFEMADIPKKILLFKMYFLWKYIINDSILIEICNTFGLNEFEEMMNINEKDVMERYQKIREENKKKMVAASFQIHSGFNKGMNHLGGSSFGVSNVNVKFNQPPTINTQSQQFISKTIHNHQNIHQGGVYPHPHQLQFHQQNQNQFLYSQPQIQQNQGNPIKKETNEEGLIFTPSPKIEKEDENENVSTLDLKEDNTIESLIISSKEDGKLNNKQQGNSYNTAYNTIDSSGINNKSSTGVFNVLLLNNKRQAEIGNSQNQQIPIQIQQQHQQQIKQNQSNPIQIQSIFIKNYKNWLFEGTKLDTSERLFTSVSILFKKLHEQTNLLEKLKVSNIIKLDYDIISIKSFKESPLLKFFFDFIFYYLFIDFKYKCSSCGFICKSDEIFWEHKHLHFSNNMLRRTSKRKDIIRKGVMDKTSWITSTTTKTRSVMSNKESSLLNRKYRSTYESVREFMFRKYVNEEENENVQKEESLISNIYPVLDSSIYHSDQDLKCGLCKNCFELRYITKYSYWFYIDIVKIDGSVYNSIGSIGSISNIDLNEEVFLHEKCILPYLIMRLSKKEASDWNTDEISYDCDGISNIDEVELEVEGNSSQFQSNIEYNQVIDIQKKPIFVFK